MNRERIFQLGDLIDLGGLEKPKSDVQAVLGQKGGNLMYREMGGLADRIEGAENVELGEVRGLVFAVKENVEKMRMVYFGDDMSWEEYNAIEGLEENTKICRAIEKDERTYGYDKLTYLPMDIARKLADKKNVGDLHLGGLKNLSLKVAAVICGKKGGLSLPSLKKINVELAIELAKHEGEFHLSGLTELSVEEAAALVKHKGHMYFDSLVNLSPEVAAELAKCACELSFTGIKEMDLEVAKALSTHKAGLYLSGLEVLNSAVAAELAKTGGILQLWKLKEIDKETARELGNFRGYLGLAGLEDMDEEIAKGLANQQGILYLIGLKGFQPGVAAALGKHRGGGMIFHEVTKITEEDARGLAQHKNGMRMQGVMDLSEEAAKILGESGIEITKLPEDALAKVNKYRMLKLSGAAPLR